MLVSCCWKVLLQFYYRCFVSPPKINSAWFATENRQPFCPGTSMFYSDSSISESKTCTGIPGKPFRSPKDTNSPWRHLLCSYTNRPFNVLCKLKRSSSQSVILWGSCGSKGEERWAVALGLIVWSQISPSYTFKGLLVKRKTFVLIRWTWPSCFFVKVDLKIFLLNKITFH